MPAARPFSRSEFIRQWSAGVSTVKMGEHFGVSKSAISIRAKSLGLPSRVKTPNCTDEEFRALWETDLTTRQIGLKLDVVPQQVSRRAKELGLPPRLDRGPPKNLEQIAAALQSGSSLREVSAAFDIAYSTLGKYIKIYNLRNMEVKPPDPVVSESPEISSIILATKGVPSKIRNLARTIGWTETRIRSKYLHLIQMKRAKS